MTISRVATQLGYECVSLDICPRHEPTICDDIRNAEARLRALGLWEPGSFDFVWASPDCRAYSRAKTKSHDDPEAAMVASDELVQATLDLFWHFDAPWCLENPDGSRLWAREVARPLVARPLGRSVKTSYCAFGYPYRKNTRLASSFLSDLPSCPGPGRCPAMVGRRHLEMAQRGGGGTTNRYHTRDELHRIPEGLVREIFKQLANDGPAVCGQRPRAQGPTGRPAPDGAPPG